MISWFDKIMRKENVMNSQWFQILTPNIPIWHPQLPSPCKSCKTVEKTEIRCLAECRELDVKLCRNTNPASNGQILQTFLQSAGLEAFLGVQSTEGLSQRSYLMPLPYEWNTLTLQHIVTTSEWQAFLVFVEDSCFKIVLCVCFLF